MGGGAAVAVVAAAVVGGGGGGVAEAAAAAAAAVVACFRWTSLPGSTSIVYLIPEGSQVKAGELLCKLDSSAYEDEEKAQLIRYLQAKSYREQASGHPRGCQDQPARVSRRHLPAGPSARQTVHRGLRARSTTGWNAPPSGRATCCKKGYRTDFQVKGDELAHRAKPDRSWRSSEHASTAV